MKNTIFKYLYLLIATAMISAFAWLQLTRVSVDELPQLKDGDIVFQTINSSQTLAVMFATGSIYTHVGMVKIGEDGQPKVIEAVEPVREISLNQWIGQGIGGRITVKRFKEDRSYDVKKILQVAEKYYGKPYDLFFLFDQEYIYCSELIYYAFRDGADIQLGIVEKVGDLNIDNAAVKKLIERRWRAHPLCKDKTDDFDSCYARILEQELVSPASIANDQKLVTIYSNYGLLD